MAGPSLYGVYFDVKENPGTRSRTPETLNITESGAAQATLVATQGWWPEFIQPFNTYYRFNTNLSIKINTTAYAKNITAHFSCDNNTGFTRPLSSSNKLIWTWLLLEDYQNEEIGQLNLGYDAAGYNTTPTHREFLCW